MSDVRDQIADLRARLAALERLEAPLSATGIFTPTFGGSTGNGTWTYSVQVGRYTRIANRVFFQLSLAAATRAVAATGSARIAGLPLLSTSVANSHSPVTIDTADNVALLAGTRLLTARVPPGATIIEFVESPGGGVASLLPASSWAATTVIRIGGHYEV